MKMVTIKIDTGKAIGKIKKMHAVGQPPFGGGYDDSSSERTRGYAYVLRHKA